MSLPRRTFFVAALALALASSAAFAQGVGINATGAAADTSALLDLSSTAKGFLAPRMTALQRAGIFLPATGLLVYQTDGTAGLYYNAGSAGAPLWKQLADNGVVTSGPWLTSGPDLFYSAGRVGVGAASFPARFTVMDSLNALRVQTNFAGGVLASFGGYGTIQVDAPGVPAGRLSLLENGYLGIGRTAPIARLDVQGGNGDVVGGEGDLRIGDSYFRLKMGVATTGAGDAGAATIMQEGWPGGYNVLALGAQGNKVLYVNGNTQRVGIGTDAPNVPLGFPPSLGKKITLYPGATGDVGFGVAGNRLQIYSDNPNADVAMGYDAAGTFNERFAVKPTGALAVLGSVGSTGQVLQSNGGGSAATWVSPTNAAFNNTYSVSCNPVLTLFTSSTPETTIPGLAQTFSVASNAKVLVSYTVSLFTPPCASCGTSRLILFHVLDGGGNLSSFFQDMSNNQRETASATFMIAVGPGMHTIDLRAQASGPDVSVGNGFMTLQVMQQ